MLKKNSITKSFTSFLLLLVYQATLSFGYVCIQPYSARSGASLHLLHRYSNQEVSFACSWLSPSVPPTRPSLIIRHETSTDEVTGPRLSKRERLSNLMKRLREISPYLRLRSSYLDARARMQSNKSTRPRETFAKDKPSLEIVAVEESTHEEKVVDDTGDVSISLELVEVEETTILREEGVSHDTFASIINVRQSTAADHVDLSGSWRPIITPKFKQEYDQYLVNCSQPFMFRKVVVNGIGYQKEIIRQQNDGVDLEITATNPAGNWNRTLVASGAEAPLNVTLLDPDGDSVQVEAWWEEGTKHKSWLRGKPRVHGGAFETIRYLESEDVLVCESFFHPSPTAPTNMKFKPGYVVWKFKRE